jgi:SAM-dependent methyltransferase
MSSDDISKPGDDLLAAAYGSAGPDANRALYARWAESYENGFIAESGYVYHEHVAGVFAAHGLERLGPDDVVVDVGCGTGLAGHALRRRGVTSIDGIDISPEMLRQAAAKRHGGTAVYRRLIEADLTLPLDVATATYAAVVSVGTFTHGHVGPDALARMLPIVRPGGTAAIGINAAHFSAADFGTTLDRLVHDGRIAGLQLIDVPIYDDADLIDPDRFAHVAVFEIT